jgi:predicted NUDIX family NTP pyrophosphohydrolase
MFLLNSEGRVLLVHPSGSFNRNAPWMPPKEEIEPGETPLEAAQRAVAEELHLPPPSGEDVRSLGSITYKSRSKTVWCFTAPYSGKDDEVRLDWENDQYRWFTLEEARQAIKDEFVPLFESLAKADTKPDG